MEAKLTEVIPKPYPVYIDGFFTLRFENKEFAEEFASGFNRGMRSVDQESPENRNPMLPFNRGFMLADKFKWFLEFHEIKWHSEKGYVNIFASTPRTVSKIKAPELCESPLPVDDQE